MVDTIEVSRASSEDDISYEAEERIFSANDASHFLRLTPFIAESGIPVSIEETGFKRGRSDLKTDSKGRILSVTQRSFVISTPNMQLFDFVLRNVSHDNPTFPDNSSVPRQTQIEIINQKEEELRDRIKKVKTDYDLIQRHNPDQVEL